VGRGGDGDGVHAEEPQGGSVSPEKAGDIRVDPGVKVRIALRILSPEAMGPCPDEERLHPREAREKRGEISGGDAGIPGSGEIEDPDR
jgi:hypothetical protein